MCSVCWLFYIICLQSQQSCEDFTFFLYCSKVLYFDAAIVSYLEHLFRFSYLILLICENLWFILFECVCFSCST